MSMIQRIWNKRISKWKFWEDAKACEDELIKKFKILELEKEPDHYFDPAESEQSINNQ